MIQEIIHVYLMPGMAASSIIFENIDLPKVHFKVHRLEWFVPLKLESLSDYALRMTKKVKHENVALVGVSFGGVLVQEMSKHIKVRKLIIVSSVKSMYEIPKHMQLAKATKAYKLVPTQLASHLDYVEKYAFGSNVKRRLELYKKYLTISDNRYLTWAIEQMVCWSQKEIIPNIIHIHK